MLFSPLYLLLSWLIQHFVFHVLSNGLFSPIKRNESLLNSNQSLDFGFPRKVLQSLSQRSSFKQPNESLGQPLKIQNSD